MRKNIIILLFLSFIIVDTLSQSYKNIALEVAEKISIKMSDTLHLSNIQRNQIYQANLSLFQEKYKVRMNNMNPEFLQYEIQKVENKRDSLYKLILDRNQYFVYKKKKTSLLRINP